MEMLQYSHSCILLIHFDKYQHYCMLYCNTEGKKAPCFSIVFSTFKYTQAISGIVFKLPLKISGLMRLMLFFFFLQRFPTETQAHMN